MRLAHVVGTVVTTKKYTGLTGVKLLILQPLSKALKPVNEPVVAVDSTMQAGEGDLVFFVGSREAAQSLPITFVPVDHAIIGIIDQIDIPYLS